MNSHGHCKGGKVSPTYQTWEDMLTRCTNPNSRMWLRYGGRGIKVCKRWQRFEKFLEDMGIRPLDCSIERKNNNKGYTPANCKWATRAEQARNRKTSKLSSEDVQFIRANYKRRVKGMAKRFNITNQMIWRIINNKTWRAA